MVLVCTFVYVLDDYDAIHYSFLYIAYYLYTGQYRKWNETQII